MSGTAGAGGSVPAGSALARVAWRAAPSLVSVAVALAVSGVVVRLAGSDPVAAFTALVIGAFGSADGLSEVLVKTCPLLLTGLAVTLAFRAGVWNIGAEGQLLMGALAMAALGPRLGDVSPWVAVPGVLVAAAAAGAAWAGIAAALRLWRGVNEVISTIMLNFVALQVVSYLVQGPLMEAAGTYPQTDAVAPSVVLPRLLPPYRVHAGLLLALALAGATAVLLHRTRAGYEMRAAGLNPAAARLAGIPVRRRVLLALLASGALAALAGAVEVSAVTRRLYERFSPGWGFTGIAVGLLGRLSPPGVVLAALFFGALEAGSGAMQRVAGVSSVLVSVVQGVVVLCLVAVERVDWRGRVR